MVHTWYIHGILHVYAVLTDMSGIPCQDLMGLFRTFFFNDIPLIYYEYLKNYILLIYYEYL